ncbi:MAG: CopG family transcriptional regulator [Planctomycetes bacterium]|nr:CopG family transcriptional regulator [Planctomycetota bacterium]
MSTTVHIPKPLLDALDRRARRLKVSRNALIVRAVQAELRRQTEWSPGFFDRLASVDPADAAAVDGMLAAVRARRTRKGPPPL